MIALLEKQVGRAEASTVNSEEFDLVGCGECATSFQNREFKGVETMLET